MKKFDVKKYQHEWYVKNKTKKSAYAREYGKKNSDKIAMYGKAWYEENKARRARAGRLYDLRVKYGITEQEYMLLFERQEGKCAVCGDSFVYLSLSVDHNHETGKVRGLLCRQCNLMIGNSKERPETLLSGAKYLESRNG